MSQANGLQFDALIPLLELSTDGIALATADRRQVVYTNERLAQWLQRASDELRGSQLHDLLASASQANALAVVRSVIKGGAGNGELHVQLAAGEGSSESAPQVAMRVCRIDAGGSPMIGLIFHWDRSSTTEGAFTRRDPLTGLLDRQFLMDRLATLLTRSPSGSRALLVFIDLDNFKLVNESHGHLVGDRVLQEVARRLAACARPADHVVRYGGDEFVLLMENVAWDGDPHDTINRIQATFRDAIQLAEGEFTLSLSIGAAELAAKFKTADEWLGAADQAMFAAKRAS